MNQVLEIFYAEQHSGPVTSQSLVTMRLTVSYCRMLQRSEDIVRLRLRLRLEK